MITGNGQPCGWVMGLQSSVALRYTPRRKADHPQSQDNRKEDSMELVKQLWNGQDGQDIAEYAVMLAVILVIVVGTIRLIGSNANNVFSNVASSIQ
jgi:Flp pilus assembly pilin Flp